MVFIQTSDRLTLQSAASLSAQFTHPTNPSQPASQSASQPASQPQTNRTPNQDLDQAQATNRSPEAQPLSRSIPLAPLPIQRPLLMVGHGTRNPQGRQDLIDFGTIYHQLDPSRPVIPCFLELTGPSIQAGIDQCVAQGYTDISVLPILLFAARHNKFDVTGELDKAKARYADQYPNLTFHYGRHFGITPAILELWKTRLALLDQPQYNPQGITRADTTLLFIGRGSSDPDANSDVYKLARMIWEGSDYQTVETCFIGITHPRLEEGFRRSRLYQPKRIIVLPYFMFTGVLMEKIKTISAQQQTLHPDIEVVTLPEMGIHPQLLTVLRDREIETQLGQVAMNCELCKFRLAAKPQSTAANNHAHNHGHTHHNHGHDHHGHTHHNHDHHSHDSNQPALDPYANPQKYHQRIWQVP